MLKRSKDLEGIVKKLSLLHFYVRARSKIGYVDVNRDCEVLFCELFNLLYDLQLINLNKKKKNQVAIDLGDSKEAVAYQITSSNDKTKIKSTTEKFIQAELYNTYKQLVVFIIGEKKKYKDITQSHLFTLDIVDIYDVIDHIATLEQDMIGRVATLMNKQIDDRFLLNLAEKNDYFSIQTYQAKSFKNGKKFMKYTFDDLKPSDNDYQMYLDDINSFIQTLSELSKETRKLLLSLIQISDIKDESVRFLPDYATSRLKCTREDLMQHTNILRTKKLLFECSIYQNGNEYEGLEVFFKTKKSWPLVYSMLDFVQNKEEQEEMFMDLDFSILD